jgi:hypothetical protein
VGAVLTSSVWTLTPCHRPHLPLLRHALTGVPHWISAKRRVVVANGDDAPRQDELSEATVIPGPDVRSVAGWWLTGMDYIAAHGGGHVVFLDSDATTDAATIEAMLAAVERWGLAYVGVDRRGVLTQRGLWIRTDTTPYTDLRWRPSGYLFTLSADSGVRPDPRYSHWYLDDDMELQAMATGGVGMVAGYVDHPDDQRWDEDTQTKRDRDRELFVAKWGQQPWM